MASPVAPRDTTSPLAGRSPDSRAGKHPEGCFTRAARLPTHGADFAPCAQWRLEPLALAYRCGGSAGIASTGRSRAPASRFTTPIEPRRSTSSGWRRQSRAGAILASKASWRDDAPAHARVVGSAARAWRRCAPPSPGRPGVHRSSPRRVGIQGVCRFVFIDTGNELIGSIVFKSPRRARISHGKEESTRPVARRGTAGEE